MNARTPPAGMTRKQRRRLVNDLDTQQRPMKVASTVLIEEQRHTVDKAARLAH